MTIDLDPTFRAWCAQQDRAAKAQGLPLPTCSELRARYLRGQQASQIQSIGVSPLDRFSNLPGRSLPHPVTPATHPQLRLVHDDRSRPRARRDELSEAGMRMKWYARHIRELREGLIDFSKIDFAEDRPKLTLVAQEGDR